MARSKEEREAAKLAKAEKALAGDAPVEEVKADAPVEEVKADAPVEEVKTSSKEEEPSKPTRQATGRFVYERVSEKKFLVFNDRGQLVGEEEVQAVAENIVLRYNGLKGFK